MKHTRAKGDRVRKPLSHVVFLVVLVALACGNLQPVALPTSDVDEAAKNASPTPEAAPAESPVGEGETAPTEPVEAVEPTEVPTEKPTALPPTEETTTTDTPTPAPSSPPTIQSFTANRMTIGQGESVTLSWQATDGAEASIQWVDQFGQLTPAPGPLDPNVGTSAVTPQSNRRQLDIRLQVSNEVGSTEEHIYLTIQCTYEWVPTLASHPPFDGCPGAPVVGAAAQQPFEKGFAIWLGPSRTIFVFYIQGPGAGAPSSYEIYTDEFSEGDPETDPSITPPAEKYQPERGFGRVWRTYDEVHDGLGWATAPEAGFQGWQQGYTEMGLHASYTLVQGTDSTIYHLKAMGSIWEVYAP